MQVRGATLGAIAELGPGNEALGAVRAHEDEAAIRSVTQAGELPDGLGERGRDVLRIHHRRRRVNTSSAALAQGAYCTEVTVCASA